VLRRIFGPKREKVTENWEKTASQGASKFILFTKYIIKVNKLWRMRWARHVGRMGDLSNTNEISVGNTEGNSSSRRPARRYDNAMCMQC
jgi:hypothetical protein